MRGSSLDNRSTFGTKNFSNFDQSISSNFGVSQVDFKGKAGATSSGSGFSVGKKLTV